MIQRWFTARSQPSASHLLVPFAHAGGSAGAYRTWQDRLGETVQVRSVQYPGHSSRFSEPLPTDCRELAADIAAALVPYVRMPLTLFGHSLGALIAFEVAAALEERHGIVAARLVVSGSPAPDRVSRDPVHSGQTDDDIVAGLRALGETSGALDDAELRQLLLPVLRADLRLGENYRPAEAHAVRTPIVAFGGADDALVSAADMDGWRRHTTAAFDRHEFAGGHFYLHDESVDAVLGRLGALLAEPTPPAPATLARRTTHG